MGVGMSVVTGLLLIVAGIIMLADPKMSLPFFIWVLGLGVITGVFAPASRLGPSANEPHPF